MGYYDEKQFLAQVDRDDNIIGMVEKWDAHKNNILHRGYTAIITYRENVILQRRKHPVFDDVFDLSFSSHQLYLKDELQSDEDAVYEGLKREWGMTKDQIAAPPVFFTKIYYQAKDIKSGYFEHEIDYIYRVETLVPPTAVAEFAYGSLLVPKAEIVSGSLKLPAPFAPWVQTLVAKHAI